jgi:hypothetical protein
MLYLLFRRAKIDDDYDDDQGDEYRCGNGPHRHFPGCVRRHVTSAPADLVV